ncbi:MAG: methylamine utilization protein [Burkholderiaceae bacterium]
MVRFVPRACCLGVPIAIFATSVQALPWTLLVRDSAGQPLADAVVAVEVKGRPAKAVGVKAELGQRDRQFIPQLLVVQTGTAVNFPNFDTVRHHVYSFSPIKVIDIKLYSGTPVEPIVFDKPGVATLGCNIHDRMSAHVIVVDTPFFAKTDASGTARLDLPAGEHQLKLWHASMKLATTLQSQPLSVGSTPGQSTVTLGE